MLLQKLFGQGGWYMVNKKLAKEWGIESAFIFSHLLDCYEYHNGNGTLDNGWFYATAEDVEEQIGTKRRVQERAIETLVQAGVIETKLRGVPARRNFRFTENCEEVVFDLIYQRLHRTNKIVQNVQTELDGTSKQDCTKRTNCFVQNVQTITNNKELKTDNKKQRVEEHPNTQLFVSEISLNTPPTPKEKSSAKKEKGSGAEEKPQTLQRRGVEKETEVQTGRNPAAEIFARLQAEEQAAKERQKRGELKLPEDGTERYLESVNTYIAISNEQQGSRYGIAKAQAFINAMNLFVQEYTTPCGDRSTAYDFIATVITAANTAQSAVLWNITANIVRERYRKWKTEQTAPLDSKPVQTAADKRANGDNSLRKYDGMTPEQIFQHRQAMRKQQQEKPIVSTINRNGNEFTDYTEIP